MTPSEAIDMLTDTTTVFRSGELLLPTLPPETAEAAAPAGWLFPTLVLFSVFLVMILLPNVFHAVPAVIRSFTRVRGTANLEGSVRTARDRNVTALVLLLPFVLVAGHAGIYTPDFLSETGADLRLALLCGVMAVYLTVRWLMYSLLRPRRRYELFALARRSVWNTFILLCLVLLPLYGILVLAKVDPETVKLVILVIITVFYVIAFFRRGRILASFCNPLTTFLYLCGLELLPTGLLVASALVL
jgi:hypothetical protein